MSTPLRILVVTDAFPPVCGGSGWSTWELTHGLVSRGHHVEVLTVEVVDVEIAAAQTREAAARRLENPFA